MDFIISAKFTPPLQRVIGPSTSWLTLDIGIEICEQLYKSHAWSALAEL